MILGVHDSVADANSCIDDLTSMGYDMDDITVISREDVVKGNVNIENDTTEGIKDGAKTGGVIGGVLGLLAGLGALTIPGLGLLFITGPVAAALGITGIAGATATGALTGALAGGLIAALKELGVDEVKAKKFEDAVKRGSILVGVAVDDEDEDEVRNCMERHDAEDITVVNLK